MLSTVAVASRIVYSVRSDGAISPDWPMRAQLSRSTSAVASDSVTRGIEGNVTALAFHNGTTFTLHPEANPTVRGEVWMTGLPQTSLTGVMAASSQYGSGRVFFCGDSSPIDDGSAQAGNSNIFDGWAEVADSLLFMNEGLLAQPA